MSFNFIHLTFNNLYYRKGDFLEEEKKYFCAHIWERGKREVNQDSLAFWWMNKGRKNRYLGVVCDGIGGLQEGENASTHVVSQIVSWYMAEGYGKQKGRNIRQELQQLLFQIHEELDAYGEVNKKKLGSTVTFFLGFEESFLWGHCGDSRLYLLRKGTVRQLTRDHKLPDGSINRAIGCGTWHLPDMGEGRLNKGDSLLLCTDGFYRGLEREELSGFAGRKIKDDEMAERMLRQILHKKYAMGERDNISAIYFGRRGKSGKIIEK